MKSPLRCSVRQFAFLAVSLCVGACSTAAPVPAPAPKHAEDPDGIVLIVENTTDRPVAVFFVEPRVHTRLGLVNATSHARLPVRDFLLRGRTLFRVYAFRGAEPCPVARVIDVSGTTTPRMTVAAADTVLRHYLPGDACTQPSSR